MTNWVLWADMRPTAPPLARYDTMACMEHSDQNVRDAQAILAVVKAIEPIWAERQAACRQVVRVALEQFWEAPRVTQGQRREPKALWSPQALTIGMAAQREDRHTGKHSALWDKLVADPVIPVDDQAAELVKIAAEGAPLSAVIAVSEGTLAILTRDEAQMLRDEGLGNGMPEDWAWGDDVWARYRKCDVDPESFKPWAGLSADPFLKVPR